MKAVYNFSWGLQDYGSMTVFKKFQWREWDSSLYTNIGSVVWKPTDKGMSSYQSSFISSLKKSVGLRGISIYEYLEKIGETRRFKKRESSKDLAKSSTSRLYINQDP